MNDDVRWIDCDLELLPDHLVGARLFSWTAWDGFRVARPVVGRVLQLHGESERVMPVVRASNFFAGFADSPPPLTWMREPHAPFVVTSHGEQPNRAVRALVQTVGPVWSRAIDWPLPSDARNLAGRELWRRLRIAERIDPAGDIPGSVEPPPLAMITAHDAGTITDFRASR